MGTVEISFTSETDVIKMFIPKILSIEKKVNIFMDVTEEAIAAAVFIFMVSYSLRSKEDC